MKTMTNKKEKILKCSAVLYGQMKKMYAYTFDELAKMVNWGSTELCLALMQLLQDGKIAQGKNQKGVYYTVV